MFCQKATPLHQYKVYRALRGPCSALHMSVIFTSGYLAFSSPVKRVKQASDRAIFSGAIFPRERCADAQLSTAINIDPWLILERVTSRQLATLTSKKR